MILHNISPDTLLEPRSSDVEYWVTPDVGYRFRKEPPGFYKTVLSNLISVREDVKKDLAKLDPNSREYGLLKEREKAVKVITNATYGYAGWVGARWYVREVAESTAAFGRTTLLRVIEMTRSVGLEIVYGDTDSIFVTYEAEKVKELLSRIMKDLGMEVKIDKIYERVIFTEAKKRYAGLLPNGKLDVVGMEAVRGDWADIAKTVQENVLELVLKDNNERRALDSLSNTISKIRARNLPLREFIIWKTLTKPVEEYEARSAHVEVAKKLIHNGWDLAVGDKIGFVITNKPGKLFEKAESYSSSSVNDIDVEYYVNSQVLPAAMRVLNVLAVKESQLGRGKETSSLADFA
jgi:DNA polymerase I